MKQLLKKSYNRDAAQYEKKFKDHQYLKYNAIFGKNVSLLKNSHTILDHGCGTGLLHDYLSQKNILPGSYTGIDFSSGMLQIARTKNIPVVESDIVQLPFKDNTFDAITSFTVIRIIDEDPERRILHELFRVLKPRGLCVITILSNRIDASFTENVKQTGFTIKHTLDCGQDTGFICNKI